MALSGDWTFTDILDFPDSDLKAQLQHHLDYLLALRSAWHSKLVVPGVWMSEDVTDCTSTRCYTFMQSREFSRGVIRLHLDLISDELLFLTDDDLIDRANRDVAPHFTLSAERHVNAKIHYNEWVNTQFSDRARYRTHMSLHQVAQILQYQGSEVLAEHAITTALDGIPGAYVRRTNVTVTVLHSSHQPSGSLPADIDLEDSLDCALIYYPIGPSTPRSLEYLAYAPIGPASPALLLTTKGPASRWREREDSGREDKALSLVLRKLALLAESSLTSLLDSWLGIDMGSGVAPPGSATTRLPACAMTIGVIYDANEINLVAQIPYTVHDGKQRFLSLLFDTLPFPSECVGSTRDFVRGRYRVALALLSLQQHVFRLVALTETPAREASYRETEHSAITQGRWGQGWNLDTPTPSFRSCESLESAISDEPWPADESDSGGESADKEQSLPEEGRVERPDFASAPPTRSGVVRYLNDAASLPPCALDGPPNIESVLDNDSTAALQGTPEANSSFECGATQIQLNRVEDVWSWTSITQMVSPDHWNESQWEFEHIAWDPPGRASHALGSYYNQAAKGYLEYSKLMRMTGPIPVSPQYRQQGAPALSSGLESVPDITLPVKLIGHALDTLNSACRRRNRIGSLGPGAYPEYVPRFFSREDVTNEQRAAVLILLHSFAQSEQLARELASERLITLTIATMFGPLSPYWTTLVTRNTIIDRDQPLFAVFLSGGPETVEKHIGIARRHIARRLHSTLTLLATRHCQAHGWESDHVFTQADAELPINEKFFVFSVIFTRQTLKIEINFPAIILSEAKSTYVWKFVDAPVMQTQCVQPLPIAIRLTIFQALLFIEQHVRLLQKELGLEG